MVDPERRDQIVGQLDRIETERDVRILYACESGSRAWGFPSTDSDYDVRVISVHPRDWYLSIDLERRDDTIDLPIRDEIDVHGWDLRKALGLFRSANPTLLDWLQSPIVYREDTAVMARWRELVPDYYTPRTAGHAYRGMARSVAEQSLADEPISHKAYLYVVRALLAVRWTEQSRDPVPVKFDMLVGATVEQAELRNAIDDLVSQKRVGQELDAGPRHPVLHDFIEAEMGRQADLEWPDSDGRRGVEPLNDFFRAVVNSHLQNG
jgi:hypothetical protein